jgi:hypothetical protein
MAEQTSLTVNVNPTNPDGTPMDLTGGTVIWKAFANGTEMIKKDTPTMLVMLAPITATTLTAAASAGQNNVHLTQVTGFGLDSWGRPILPFTAGDVVTLTNVSGASEYATISQVSGLELIMTAPLQNSYAIADACQMIISQFTFQLLPGDTILPSTKSYGTQIVWDHMAVVEFPVGLGPQDIYQVPTTLLAIRGRMFILPIEDMS